MVGKDNSGCERKERRDSGGAVRAEDSKSWSHGAITLPYSLECAITSPNPSPIVAIRSFPHSLAPSSLPPTVSTCLAMASTRAAPCAARRSWFILATSEAISPLSVKAGQDKRLGRTPPLFRGDSPFVASSPPRQNRSLIASTGESPRPTDRRPTARSSEKNRRVPGIWPESFSPRGKKPMQTVGLALVVPAGRRISPSRKSVVHPVHSRSGVMGR